MYVTLKTDDIFHLKTIHRLVKEVPKTFPETLSCNLRQLFQKLQDVVVWLYGKIYFHKKSRTSSVQNLNIFCNRFLLGFLRVCSSLGDVF